MNLPFFFAANIFNVSQVTLDTDTSRHVVQVLRMQIGEKLQLTDGKGNLALAEITQNDKNNCKVNIISCNHIPRPSKKISIALSLLKQPARFEWFLEKATEVGVFSIITLKCARTEKQHFRKDRWEGILSSAMLQSKQVWLPELLEPVNFNDAVDSCNATRKFIAYCDEDLRKLTIVSENAGDAFILIGPEGDFTKDEVNYALSKNFIPVTLGNNRLRSETAALVSCILLAQ